MIHSLNIHRSGSFYNTSAIQHTRPPPLYVRYQPSSTTIQESAAQEKEFFFFSLLLHSKTSSIIPVSFLFLYNTVQLGNLFFFHLHSSKSVAAQSFASCQSSQLFTQTRLSYSKLHLPRYSSTYSRKVFNTASCQALLSSSPHSTRFFALLHFLFVFSSSHWNNQETTTAAVKATYLPTILGEQEKTI